jgi:3-oxoacyl-(acyl-carrier-protein) synthase
MSRSAEYLRGRAQELGAERERKPASGVVITGFAALTHFGDERKTYTEMLNGASAAKFYPTGNKEVVLSAPVTGFNHEDHFDRRDVKDLSFVGAMTQYVAQRALNNAGLLNTNNKFIGGLDMTRVSTLPGSGIGQAPNIIRVFERLFRGVDVNKYFDEKRYFDPEVNKDVLRSRRKRREDVTAKIQSNARLVRPTWVLGTFPEEVNGDISKRFGSIQGWGLMSSEACATGLSSAVEGARLIRDGYSDIAIVGGFEDMLTDPNKLGMGMVEINTFANMTVLGKSRDPQSANKPFDRDRDGFVAAAGAGIIILESREHAEKRGANILAEIGGFSKGLDGKHPTELYPPNVARITMEALYDPISRELQVPDVVWAHATATKPGDRLEAHALYEVLGNYLKETPVAAIKGNLDHTMGAAGALNLIAAIQSLHEGVIPHILNLNNPQLKVEKDADEYDEFDFEVEENIFPSLIRNTPLSYKPNSGLVVAYGFGGHNAAMLVRKPQE